MPHKRSIGKLEAKIARNYCHEHLQSKPRNGDPDEILETVFVGSVEEMQKAVLSEVGANRTGEIPDYPRGLVCFDSNGTGFFSIVAIEDEVSVLK